MSLLGNYFMDYEATIQMKPLRTPVEYINLALGGLPQGKVTILYGESRSGKSTFVYQTAAYAMKDNPNCFLTIIDCESASDAKRLKNAFGIDLSRVKVAHVTTVEDSMTIVKELNNAIIEQRNSKLLLAKAREMSVDDLRNMVEGVEKGLGYIQNPITGEWIEKTKEQLINELLYRGIVKPSKSELTQHVIVWDTVAAATIRESEEKIDNNDSLNMRDKVTKASVIKNYLSNVVASIGDKPITLLIINQVNVGGIGSWGGTYETMSGGNALYHLPEVRIHTSIDYETKTGGEDWKTSHYGEYVISNFSLEKNRQGCRKDNIKVRISEELGGVICEPIHEVLELALELNIIKDLGRKRYQVTDTATGNFPVSEKEKYTWDEFIDNKDYWYEVLKEKICAQLRKKYVSVNSVWEFSDTPNYGNPDDIDKRLFNFEPSDDLSKKEETKSELEKLNSDDDMSLEEIRDEILQNQQNKQNEEEETIEE